MGVSVVVPIGPNDKPPFVRGADEVLPVKGGTPSEARNLGADLASHDNILFMDADMRIETDLSDLPKYGFELATAFYCSQVPRDRWIVQFQNHMARRGNMWAFLGGFMYTSREAFEDVGGFRSGVWEDIEFAWRARRKGYRINTFPLKVVHTRPFNYRHLSRGFLGDGWVWGFG